MREIGIAIITAFLLAGCRGEVERSNSPTIPPPTSFTHAWVMTGWEGYMGVAIALTTNEYYYWFYSDVGTGDEPKYPLTGSYTLAGSNLHLVSDVHLYSTDWIATTNSRGWPCLIAPSDIGDPSRLLVKHPQFDPKQPFSWNQLLKQNTPSHGTGSARP